MALSDPVTRLTEEESWSLLRSVDLGRLATVIDRQPDISPVNFVVDGAGIVFRTAEGSKLLSLTVNSVVAFEADGWGEADGWSVVIKGRARELTEAAALSRAEALPLRPWVPTIKLHYVRIDADQITGRRFRFGPEPEPAYT